jgi:hypothetical protein
MPTHKDDGLELIRPLIAGFDLRHGICCLVLDKDHGIVGMEPVCAMMV